MGCSIESRVPFLDHKLVEFAAQVPDHLKIRGRSAKYILKRAVEPILPHDIIYRKKMGFPTPVRKWLREAGSDHLFSILRSRDGVLSDYLDRRQLDSLIDRHRSGLEDSTDRIWRLLNLQIWGDLFLTGNRDLWGDGLLSAASAR